MSLSKHWQQLPLLQASKFDKDISCSVAIRGQGLLRTIQVGFPLFDLSKWNKIKGSGTFSISTYEFI